MKAFHPLPPLVLFLPYCQFLTNTALMSETFADFRIISTIILMTPLWKMPSPTCLSVCILVGCWLQVMIFTRLIEMSHLGLSPINYYCARVIL